MSDEPARKKRKKTGGKRPNPYEPNADETFLELKTKTDIVTYKNLMSQYHTHIKEAMESVSSSTMPYDIRELSAEILNEAGVLEAFASSARLLSTYKAAHGLGFRAKGSLLRYDGYHAYWRKFCNLWRKSKKNRSDLRSEEGFSQRVNKAIFELTRNEEIAIPTLAPSETQMKQIICHIKKEDSVLNLVRRLIIYMCLYFESRSGMSLNNICFQSFRFVENPGILLYREQDTKSGKYKKGKIKISMHDKDFKLAFNAYYKLRKAYANENDGFFLAIRKGCEDCDVLEQLRLQKPMRLFENKPMTNNFIKTWFYDLCLESGIPKEDCEHFRGKSIRQFLAIHENENGVCSWKNRSLVDCYDKDRRALHKSIQTALH